MSAANVLGLALPTPSSIHLISWLGSVGAGKRLSIQSEFTTVRGFLCLLIVRPGRNLLLAIMLWVSLVGTSESFMHHPANDRSWPKALVRVIHMNDRSGPFSAVRAITSRDRLGSEIAAGYQNMRVCFGEFVADGCRENPKI